MTPQFLTYCDSAYEQIGDISIPRMQVYCAKHELAFHKYCSLPESHCDVYWYKIQLVRLALDAAPWVIWCDADILINDMTYNWTEYLAAYATKDFLISQDHRGLCLGFFVVRSTERTRRLLDAMLTLGNIKSDKVGVYDTKNRWEQDTLKVLADHFDVVHKQIHLIPEGVVSNPKTYSGNLGFFARHFWANANSKVAACVMQRHLTHDIGPAT